MGTHLDKFRDAQRLAYACVTEVGRKLVPGMTEKDAARLLAEDLRARGVTDHFHRPLAWFGERTRFDGMRGYRSYLPSSRRLGPSDVVILDVSPIVDGCIGDVGYTLSLQENAELDRAQACLLDLRKLIPAWFASERTLGEVWQEVDRHLANQGFANCYALYPFSVLGHQIVPIKTRRRFGPSVPISHLSWFGLSAYRLFLPSGILPLLMRKRSHQSKQGIWAIEPHLGGRGFGAKFEEMLVVEGNQARWLDQEVPHLKNA